MVYRYSRTEFGQNTEFSRFRVILFLSQQSNPSVKKENYGSVGKV